MNTLNTCASTADCRTHGGRRDHLMLAKDTKVASEYKDLCSSRPHLWAPPFFVVLNMSLNLSILCFPNELFQVLSMSSPQSSHSSSPKASNFRPQFLGQCKCNPADTNLCIRDTLLVVQMQSSWQYVHSLLGGWLNYSLHCPHHQMWHYSDVCVCFCLHFKGVQLWRFLVSVPSRVSRMLESTLSTRPRPRLQH